MNEKVHSFIKKMQEKEKNNKAKRLILLGLYEKEYSPYNRFTNDFPFSEWDSASSTNKYYKKVPVEITDEEYEEVKKYSKLLDVENDKNPIASMLRIIGIIVYLAGFIASFFLGVDRYGDLSAMVVVWWFVFFISGTFYMGFAEIIQLLDDIKKK